MVQRDGEKSHSATAPRLILVRVHSGTVSIGGPSGAVVRLVPCFVLHSRACSRTHTVRAQRRGWARRSARTSSAPSPASDVYFWSEGRTADVIIAVGYRVGPFEVASTCSRASGRARDSRGRVAGRAPGKRR
jgi:hypothetical protein